MIRICYLPEHYPSRVVHILDQDLTLCGRVISKAMQTRLIDSSVGLRVCKWCAKKMLDEPVIEHKGGTLTLNGLKENHDDAG